MILPIKCDAEAVGVPNEWKSTTYTGSTLASDSRVLNHFQETGTSTTSPYLQTVPVFLKRYQIEGGGEYPIGVGTCGPVIKNFTIDEYGTSESKAHQQAVLGGNAATDTFAYYVTVRS